MNFIDYPDEEMLAIDLANKLAGELTAALEHEERVLFVVPGGTTPGPIFDALCEARLDWSRVDIALSDERWIPETDPRSNTRLLRERLLVGRASEARFLPMYADAHAPEEVLAELESNISPNLPIAVLLLGMGEDLHIASLFPRADRLEDALDRHAPVLLPIRVPDAAETRVTFSARVLNDALRKHIVITGQKKRDALEDARGLPPEDAPVMAVLDGTTVHWTP